MSFALIDVDGLEELNATRGRSFGDRLLFGTAARLNAGFERPTCWSGLAKTNLRCSFP